MTDHEADPNPKTEEGPLEAAFRSDMTEAFTSVPRLAEAFEHRDATGETVSVNPTAEETAQLNMQVLWTVQKHVGRLAAEIDRLAVKLD